MNLFELLGVCGLNIPRQAQHAVAAITSKGAVRMAQSDMASPDLRRFIRHPADISIEVELSSVVAVQTEHLYDISEGGLCFKSKVDLPRGALLKIRIPLVRPTFETHGRVVWSSVMEAFFNIGVEFLHQCDVFRARMVEQVCHIEHYKREVLERDGRTLTSEQAAMEWIEKYAADFPRPGAATEMDSSP